MTRQTTAQAHPMTTIARRTRTPNPLTDQQRMHHVFDALARERIAFWFDLRGSTGAREDRYHDYMRAATLIGTTRWVGEHVGNRDCGGGYWGDDGRLYGGRPNGMLYNTLWWSHSHEHPEVADLLTRLLRAQGFDAWWSGEPYDSVAVTLT